ncbi:MAG: hypothetical protein IPK60_03950 [Sandaracinaceae bacterium]|nr:hypothetical protein [Sandaracinaceae bacterium]
MPVAAAHVCERCGSFFCSGCACRTRPEALPMCPACWALRAQSVTTNKEHSPTRIHSVGLGLGIASLLPIPVLQIGSLVVNIIALVRSFTPETESSRWKAILGLVLTVFGFGIDVALLTAAVMFK